MTDKLSTFVEKHGSHAMTVIFGLVSLGITFQVFIGRLENLEKALAESRADRSEIRAIMVNHVSKQAETESVSIAKLTRIETDVSWIKDTLSRKSVVVYPPSQMYSTSDDLVFRGEYRVLK